MPLTPTTGVYSEREKAPPHITMDLVNIPINGPLPGTTGPTPSGAGPTAWNAPNAAFPAAPLADRFTPSTATSGFRPVDAVMDSTGQVYVKAMTGVSPTAVAAAPLATRPATATVVDATDAGDTAADNLDTEMTHGPKRPVKLPKEATNATLADAAEEASAQPTKGHKATEETEEAADKKAATKTKEVKLSPEEQQLHEAYVALQESLKDPELADIVQTLLEYVQRPYKLMTQPFKFARTLWKAQRNDKFKEFLTQLKDLKPYWQELKDKLPEPVKRASSRYEDAEPEPPPHRHRAPAHEPEMIPFDQLTPRELAALLNS